MCRDLRYDLSNKEGIQTLNPSLDSDTQNVEAHFCWMNTRHLERASAHINIQLYELAHVSIARVRCP